MSNNTWVFDNFLDIHFCLPVCFFVVIVVPGRGSLLEVSSKSVSGDLHGNVTMTWTVKKCEKSDHVASAVLILGKNTSEKALFQGVYNPPSKKPASRIFGGRINANWHGPNFTIQLQNLKCNDTVSFTLVVSVSAEDHVIDRGKASRTITITKVNGMYILFECWYSMTECMVLPFWQTNGMRTLHTSTGHFSN